jgi:hypothetical protein
MTDRTEWDDVVDEAIGQLIDEDTEAFSVATIEDEDVHLVQAADLDEQLLSVWILVQQIVRQSEAAGTPLQPMDVLVGAADVAKSRGLLEDGASYRDELPR